MKKTHYLINKLLLFLLLTFTLAASSFFVLVPNANAHTPPWSVPTFAYLAISPDPVGLGQQGFFVMWVSPNPPTAMGNAGDRWRAMTITVTKPDGTTQTLGPFNSDPTGSTYTLFTPDQTGTYKAVLTYPGQVMTLINPINGIAANVADLVSRGSDVFVNDTFLPSSATITFTVTTNPTPKISDYPLPASYWTRPIDQENTAWSSISSNWLSGSQLYSPNLWQMDGTGPNSAHILWTRPIELGGIVGGSLQVSDTAYYTGGAYEGRFTNAIILGGKLFYAEPLGHSNTGGGYTCVDLQTGDLVWHRDDINIYTGRNAAQVANNTAGDQIPGPTFAQLYDYESPNQHGVVGGLLWQTTTVGTVVTWQAFDAYTGKWVFNETNIPTGTQVYTKYGEIVRYVLNYNANTKKGSIALWNNTAEQQGLHLGTGTGTNAWQWRPNGKSVNMANAYSWNVTINADLSGLNAPSIVYVIPGDIIVGQSTTFTPRNLTPDPYTLWAISDKPSSKGQLLWIKNYSAPSGGISRSITRGSPVDPVNRVLLMQDTETMQWLGYSIDTGTLLWGPTTTPVRAYTYYGSGGGGGQTGFVAYGNLYTQGYGGEIFCYNTKNGQLVWKYNNTNSGDETPWGLYPIFIAAIADGKVYAFNNEHSPNDPLYKGEKVRCLDAYTGQELWTMLSWVGQSGGGGTSTSILADGVLCYYNYYDSQIYAIGKGPSAVAVQALPGVGNTVTIQGTVTDISAGAKNLVQSGKFNIVPAVSDVSEGPWMEYLYMQKPMPTNATGVPVNIFVTDASGVTTQIATVTSDSSGLFCFGWTPSQTGTYKITAVFDGSNSYWSSSATTAVAVNPIQAAVTTQPTTTPTETTQPSQTPTVTATPTVAPTPGTGISTETLLIAGAAIVIIIAVIASALVLRKRK
jgi:outer membrane protein assembly factor BamB